MQLLQDGSPALPATEEVADFVPEPMRPTVFFRPALPLRPGKTKSTSRPFMRLDSQYELAAELASVGDELILVGHHD